MPDGAPDPLAFLFANPVLGQTGIGTVPEPTTGTDNLYAGGTTDTSAPTTATDTSTSAGVYTPTKPNYVSMYNTGAGTMQQLLKSLYTPDDSEQVKQQPAVTTKQTIPAPEDTTTTPDTTKGPGYYQTKDFLRHGQEVIDENDRVVGTAGKLTLSSGASADGIVSNDVLGTEFGEIDRPSRGGYTEAGWDKGAWGANLTGEDNEGVALPAHILNQFGNWHSGNFGNDFNSKYDVVVTNPDNGKQTIASLKDAGPGESVKAGLDMLWGTRAKLGLEPNASNRVHYSIVPKGTYKSAENNQTTFGHDGSDPNLEGAALPSTVVKNSIGDYENDPDIYKKIANADYKMAISNAEGLTKLVPIVHTTGADWTGHALHLTGRTAQDLGIADKGKVGYQLIGPDGGNVPIKGYHPETIARANWDDHIGPARLGEMPTREEAQLPGARMGEMPEQQAAQTMVARKLAGGKKFNYEKYNVPIEQGGYLRADGTTDFAKADADKAADQAIA